MGSLVAKSLSKADAVISAWKASRRERFCHEAYAQKECGIVLVERTVSASCPSLFRQTVSVHLPVYGLSLISGSPGSSDGAPRDDWRLEKNVEKGGKKTESCGCSQILFTRMRMSLKLSRGA